MARSFRSNRAIDRPQVGEQGIDASGYWVAPGLIDIHMHGALGYDFMDASPEAVNTIAAHCARHGVTSYLGTTVSSSPGSIQAAIDNLANNPVSKNGARALGLHIEGPYLDVNTVEHSRNASCGTRIPMNTQAGSTAESFAW